MSQYKPYKPNQTQFKPKMKFNSNSRPRSNTKRSSFNKYPPFKGRTSFARIVDVDSDDEDDNEDPMPDHSNSGPNELSISDLAARTVRFSDEQREEWVQEMKKRGADFQ
jgi:hypothetical protein